MKLAARLALLMLLTSGAAQAAPMTVTFTTDPTGFFAGLNVPAPQSTVSGSFTFDAVSPTSPIQSLTGVDLTIAGHVYTLADVGFVYDSGIEYIGGVVDGSEFLAVGSDDFLFSWTVATGESGFFTYTVQGGQTIFGADPPSIFSIAPTVVPDPINVPEPASLSLLALGLAGVGAVRRRRR